MSFTKHVKVTCTCGFRSYDDGSAHMQYAPFYCHKTSKFAEDAMKFPKTKNEQKTVKPAIQKVLDKHGWFWWSNPASPFGRNGVPDMMAVHNSVFMVIEAKHSESSHGKNGPTALQLGFLNSIKSANHLAFVVNEHTVHVLDKFLTAFATCAECEMRKWPIPEEVGAAMMDGMAILTNYPALAEPNL